jgi:hypothetical protein
MSSEPDPDIARTDDDSGMLVWSDSSSTNNMGPYDHHYYHREGATDLGAMQAEARWRLEKLGETSVIHHHAKSTIASESWPHCFNEPGRHDFIVPEKGTS